MDFVVRCTACREASAVEAAGRGQIVRCPHCSFTFVAVPELPVAAAEDPPPPPRRPRNPERPARDPDRPARNPDRPPRRRRRHEDYAETDGKTGRPAVEDHDPHRHLERGLPASVLIGLALLPFVIPILWLTTPALFGNPPAVSIAVPAALALTASILSLAVIYTIDWTPTVRVKGVLMIVGLAYLIAASFYFLKPEMVAWLKQKLWHDDWKTFSPPSGGYTVRLPPGKPAADSAQPVWGVRMECYVLRHTEESGKEYTFIVGASQAVQPKQGFAGPQVVVRPPAQPELGSQPWFDKTMKDMAKDAGGEVVPGHTKRVNPPSGETAFGREFVIKLKGDVRRMVRLYAIRNRVIYLAVEATDLSPEDPIADKFFEHLYTLGM